MHPENDIFTENELQCLKFKWKKKWVELHLNWQFSPLLNISPKVFGSHWCCLISETKLKRARWIARSRLSVPWDCSPPLKLFDSEETSLHLTICEKKLRYDILDLTKSDNNTFVQTPSGFPRKSTLHSYPNEENCSQELMDATLSQDCRTNEEELEKSREEWYYLNNLNNK